MIEQDRTAFLRHAEAAQNANSPDTLRGACKKLMVLCWMNLTERDRMNFIGQTDPVSLDFKPLKRVALIRDDHELTVILTTLDRITVPKDDEAAHEFVSDLLKRRHFKNFKLTDKQAEWLRRIWKTYSAPVEVGDEIETPIVEDE